MASLKSSNRTDNPIKAAECVHKGTLLLLLLLMAISPVQARQRDTLGIGGRTYFVENRGQWQAPFLFKAQMYNAALFVERDCFTVTLRERTVEHDHQFHHHVGQMMHAYKVMFEGCNPQVTVSGQDIDAACGLLSTKQQ